MLEYSDSKKTKNRKCIICKKILGYYYQETKTNRKLKRYYFSDKPWIYNDKEYYRNKCIDCFLKEFNRVPLAPNVVNYDYQYLLENVTKKIIEEISSSKAVTLENLIKKYGQEIGEKKYKIYCEKQAFSNSLDYKKEKYGWTEEDFKNFNKNRAVTLENLIKKHGLEKGKEKFEKYCNRQAYAGNALEYFIEKYGEEKGKEKYHKVNKNKAITLKNMIKIYGEEIGKEKYDNWKESLIKNININVRSSKSSQELFWFIYNNLDNKDGILFKDLNSEYCIHHNNRYYFYDFVDESTKRVIEFNGEHCHPNKNKLTNEQWNLWFDSYTKMNANEKYKFDQEKNNLIESNGYIIKIIWYNDYKSNQEKIKQECLDFIKGE